MSIGQRIMQKRKELGLSQEALGEKLGVSRQAIYKWESDTTLPEIEKLVALSKIFSVTVGELLGVEEPAPENAEATADHGELTASQIKMVEEIVNRYRDSIPQPEPPKKRRQWPRVVAVAVIAVMAVSLLRLNGRLQNLQNNYQNLQASVSNIDRRVGNQIDSITVRVEDVLNRVNSFTTDQSAKIDSVDFEAGTITFSLYAVPKTYTDGMTAHFQAVSGDDTVETEGTLGNNRDFHGKITLPLNNDNIDLSVTFTTGDKQDIQPINSFNSLYDCSFPFVCLEAAPLFFDVRDDVLSTGHYLIRFREANQDTFIPQSEINMEKTRLGLFADGVLVRWMEPEEMNPESQTDMQEHTLSFCNPESLQLDRSKTYCLAAVITDTYGRELVVPDIPIFYQERENDWSWVENDDDGVTPYPEKWVY